jgi:hypothetical protein
VHVDRWIAPDAGHVDAMWVHPDEYEDRLGHFFGATFAE